MLNMFAVSQNVLRMSCRQKYKFAVRIVDYQLSCRQFSFYKTSNQYVILFPSCFYMFTNKRYISGSGKNVIERKHGMNENIWNIPNILTLSRIISSPFLTYAIINDYKTIALAGCMISALTDWLDGYIAKTYNMKTVFGSFLDPLADKIFIGALSLALTYKGLLPLPLFATIISRDIFLVIGSFYKRHKEKDKDSLFFDTNSSATFIISPSELSKVNSGLQFLILTLTLIQYSTDYHSIIYALEPLWWITSVTTIGSGLDYMIDGKGTTKK